MTPLCRHIRTTGHPCRAVALAQQPYCYYHHRLHDRHRTYRRDLTREWQTASFITLDAIEDRHGLQVALSQVVNAAATGHLEPRLATVLLRGLAAIARNLTQLEKLPQLEAEPIQTALLSKDGLDLTPLDPTLTTPAEAQPQTTEPAPRPAIHTPAPSAQAGETPIALSPEALPTEASPAQPPIQIPPPSLARIRMWDALGVSSHDRDAIQRDLQFLAQVAHDSTVHTEHPHGYTAP